MITTTDGHAIDVNSTEGPKNRLVLVFRDSEGGYIAVSPGDIVESGTPIEVDGTDEGEDMGYIGTGFLVN